MEVLPSSDVKYVGESDGSGTGFIYDVKMGDVVEESKSERGGDVQWLVDELPVSEEGRFNGDSIGGVDAQDFACNSIYSEADNVNAEEDHCSESLIVPDTIESEPTSSNKEGDFSLSELKWLERAEPLAVWVKWRGNWQAGIKCARVDWPLSTVKARPTHERKKYLVVFFPRTRNYSWVDVLLVRPINEFPQPIAYSAHKVGVKIVKDLSLASRFIMQKLAVGMLNIIDQLHSQALEETARDVKVWKEFAMEASQCKDYSDLGRMLLKLQNMIQQRYFHSHWLQQDWVQRCLDARSAESLETLKEELVDSIQWNEVTLLPNVEFGFEWKSWKQESMKLFSMSNSPSSGGPVDPRTNNSPSTTGPGLQISRKRPKLEIRRAEPHSSHAEAREPNRAATVETHCGFFDGGDAAAVNPSRSEIQIGGDRWSDIVVETGNSENLTAAKKPLTSGIKNRYCIAFIEAKGRQCVRLANDGDVYCCVHLASRFVQNTTKAEKTPIDQPMCEGTTVLGTKCKHRSLFGSSFCKKHRPHDKMRTDFSGSPESKLKRKLEGSYCKDIVLLGENEEPLEVDPISMMRVENFSRNSSIEMMTNCISLGLENGDDRCLEIPTKHSLYCEKHLPSWLKRARNGKSRIVSKEVFLDLLKDCSSREQKLFLHQACELFYRFFKSVLSLRNPVPKDVQLHWAISEASKNQNVGKFLMKLVCSEKERLQKLWGFNSDKDIEETNPIPMTNVVTDADDENVIMCKICSEKFSDDHVLGAHWMDFHKKEAQWLFRGYVCAICLDSFTNKKLLEAHVQDRHHVQFVEQCMLFQCIPCGSHFGNPEQLWLHVLSVHSTNFRQPNSHPQQQQQQQQQKLSVADDSSCKIEPSNLNPSENVNSEGTRKFICKFCGLKFDLLPDLGRHHQAAHMVPNPLSSRLQKRGIRYYSYRLKSGRLTRPKFKKGLGAVSYGMRNKGVANVKKHIQLPRSVSAGEIQVQSPVSEAAGLGNLPESQCSEVAKILFSQIKKTKPRPNNSDILTLARSACCKFNLQTSLEEKFGALPKRIYLKAAKICSEQNILVSWHQDGYICPKGCKSVSETGVASPLVPLPDGIVSLRCEAPSDRGSTEWTMDESHCIIDSQHFRQETVESSIVLCDDISFGQESVPVACVVDENLLGSLHMMAEGSEGQTNTCPMPWESFTYIKKSLLDQSLQLEPESMQLGCSCTQSACSSETCDHVYLFNNDYEDAKDIHGRPMHNRFAYDDNGRLIVEEGYLVYECNSRCSCSRMCKNRVLQNGVQVKLEVFKTDNKGWAVRAGEAISRGTFVCEYIGEVLDEQEAKKRRDRYDGEGCSYLFEIDGQINDMSRLIEGQVTYVIDARDYGNVSRYINHSCSPNLMNHQVLVESMDYQLAHIGLYASRDIAIGEEITYDYRYKLLPGQGSPCLCRSSNCRGRLH